MSASELAEHLGYLTDPVKLDAYRAALREVVTPESVVLDLGAGTGLLGLLALQAGARRVYAVDGGAILDLARDVADLSGLADRVTHVRGHSTQVELPEQVDVVVCDQIGGFVHDAGILGYYADATARLLRPGGVLVPSSFELWLTPVGNADLASRVLDWHAGPEGVDLTPFADAAANTEHRVNAPPDCRLGPGAAVAEIRADHATHFGGGAELDVDRQGAICGLLGTFVARMSPTVTLTNAPWAEKPMKRWQNLYPFPNLADVGAGDRIEATIDVSPKTGVVAWTGTIRRPSGADGPTFSQDTLRGSFAGPASIIRASDKWTPAPNEQRLAAARTVLDSADGSRSVDDLAALIEASHPGLFVGRDHARDFVRSVIGSIVDPSAG